MHSNESLPALEFVDVSKVFGERRVIDHQTFSVKAGEIFVIIGPSGTGKSVSLKLASGQLTPTEGEIRVLGESLTNAPLKQLEGLRKRMGYLFQSGALLGWKTLRENVALPLEVRGKMKPKAIDEAVTKALFDVGLETSGDLYPAEVSGGMVKRAAFARAIVENPELLFFDEPTSGLDPVMSRTIDGLITQINRDYGAACVVVTHDLAGALRYAHRIAFLKNGRFLEVTTPEAILTSQQPDIQAFLAAQSMEVHHGK
jgi:phospholipid/cholesterol/gamma-HCH transport system ATP-binding protein